jgi:hypothetical protein
VTAKALLVSAQGHHLGQLGNTADNHCELAAFFCFPSRALQASNALEQQVTRNIFSFLQSIIAANQEISLKPFSKTNLIPLATHLGVISVV